MCSNTIQNQKTDPEDLGSIERGQKLHGSPASDQGDKMLVRVESVDKIDNDSLSVHCSTEVSKHRSRFAPDPPQDDSKRATDNGAQQVQGQ